MAAYLVEQARKLLDFNQGLDIGLLDSFVSCMYSGSGDEQRMARDVLTALNQHPQTWLFFNTIIEKSQKAHTHYFALQILESVIKTRWKTLSREECEGIKIWTTNLINGTVSESDRAERSKIFLTKLDMILVLIVVREWPKHWRSFISDMVEASKTNESLCKNTMVILKLLSEEVFDISSSNMTRIKAKHLKDFMLSEFSHMLQLFQFVTNTSANADLLLVTLETLIRFLSWVPPGQIFDSKLITTLIYKIMGVPLSQDVPLSLDVLLSQNVALKCLTDLAGLAIAPQYGDVFMVPFSQMMLQFEKIIPLDTNIIEAFAMGCDAYQNFVQNQAMFLCTMLKQHRHLMEETDKSNVLKALQYLLLISEVEETEIFKICLEYWNALAKDLYKTPIRNITSVLEFRTKAGVVGKAEETCSYWFFYKNVFSRLCSIIISQMAKPEEVLVIENDYAEIIQESIKDTDSINLHKLMRETLLYLTYLDHLDVERIMTDKFESLVNGSEWSWKKLNTLCWAIGSISGSMHEKNENRLLVKVIDGLLDLYEKKEGKGSQILIASNILYVAGQYPRFLRAHFEYLKKLVNKILEFMHDKHRGIQEMACEKLIEITQKCKGHFVFVQVGEVSPFFEEVLTNVGSIVLKLGPQQVLALYEAVGYMISAENDISVQDSLIQRYMHLPNQEWDDIINQATRKDCVLKDVNVVKQLADVLKINVRACKALGHAYVFQLHKIYPDMLRFYKVMSANISEAIFRSGEHATQQLPVRYMRLFKKMTVKLISEWVNCSNDPDLALFNLIDPLLNAVLNDYQHCAIPSARDSEVLSTMATIVNKLEEYSRDIIPKIFDAVLQCTIDMIKENFDDFPEHGINFYLMLQAVNNHCFPAFVSLPSAQFKLVLDSIIWAFKHKMRNVADMGLDILYQLLQNVSQNEKFARSFYLAYYSEILEHLFSVVTDTAHAAALTMHATILAYMFTIVEMGKVNVSLNPAAPFITPPGALAAANVVYVQNFVTDLLHKAFPHLTPLQLEVTVEGLFNLDQDLTEFREHLKDFLVQIKEFTGKDDSDLFLEERKLELMRAQEEKSKVQMSIPMSVPGIINPHEIAEEMHH